MNAQRRVFRNRRASLLLSSLCVAIGLLASATAEGQRIQFDPDAPAVKLVPFFEFEGNFADFCGDQCSTFQGAPTLNTPLIPTDIASLPNGHYLINTLGGTIKLVDELGQFRGNLLDPITTGTTRADPVRFGSTSLELHPDFGAPGTFGYGKAYHIVSQLPSEGTRRNIPETGVPADFSPPQKQAYDADAGEVGSAFFYQVAVREYDLSGWADSGFAASDLNGASAPPIRDVLRIDQLGGNHGTFDLAFNTVGDLFVTTGDGGFNEGPTHADFAGRNRRQSSQNPNEVYGKILRINPDVNAPHAGRVGQNGQYSIPADNPYFDTTLDPRFVLPNGVDPENDGDPQSTIANSTVFQNNDGTLDEIWAVGVRSPIRLENDRRDPSGNTLILGDVGAGSREEATLFGPQANGNAANLGWGRFEGTITNNGSITLAPESTLVGPDFEYDHSGNAFSRTGGLISGFNNETGGLAIEGGEIYVGEELGPEFEGKYVAAELGFHNTSNTKLSRLILGDFDNPGTFTALRIDPDGQRFDSPLLGADAFSPSFDFDQPGVDFFGDGTRLLPDRIYGVYADDATGELFLLGGSVLGGATISRIVSADIPIVFPGDNNFDGVVDAADYTVWRDNLGARGVPRFELGDASGDRRVNEIDYFVWRDNFGQTVPPATAEVTPEPTTALLLSMAALAVLAAHPGGLRAGTRE